MIRFSRLRTIPQIGENKFQCMYNMYFEAFFSNGCQFDHFPKMTTKFACSTSSNRNSILHFFRLKCTPRFVFNHCPCPCPLAVGSRRRWEPGRVGEVAAGSGTRTGRDCAVCPGEEEPGSPRHCSLPSPSPPHRTPSPPRHSHAPPLEKITLVITIFSAISKLFWDSQALLN